MTYKNRPDILQQLEEAEQSNGGLADVWLEHNQDNFLHVNGTEEWFQFVDGTHWKKVGEKRVRRDIAEYLSALYQEADRKVSVLRKSIADDDSDEQKKIAQNQIKHYEGLRNLCKRSKTKIASVLSLCADTYYLDPDDLNTGNVLNLKNVLLDLDTGIPREHSRDDYQTYTLDYSYEPDATAPRFEQFLSEVLVRPGTKETDPQLVKLVTEFMAYSLTEETHHQKMLWMSGMGANGKSVLIGIIQKLLGPLATSVEFESLGDAGNYDMADLVGKRVVFSTEAAKGKRINEKALKQIVSAEDTIKARPIYGQPIEFQPVGKIIWSMNDRPQIQDTSNAIWRRLMLVPFDRQFDETEQDTQLHKTLEAELSGILNVLLSALDRLRTNGRFTESDAVKEAAEQYKLESNPVQQWREEFTEPTDSKSDPKNTQAKVAYMNYSAWADNNGRNALNSTNFGKELARLGAIKYKTKRGMYYQFSVKNDLASSEDATESGA